MAVLTGRIAQSFTASINASNAAPATSPAIFHLRDIAVSSCLEW